MYPLRTLPALSSWSFGEWVWAILTTGAVVLVLLAAAKGARADVMPPVMAEAHAEYRQALHDEFIDELIAVNGPYIAPVVASAPHTHPPTSSTPPPADVESWRPLVATYFPANRVDEALKVMWCESRGDPSAKNPGSTASGLFQILRGWWSGDWSSAIPAFDPFDPVANVSAASIIAGGTNYWQDWAASRSCHGLS